MTVTSGFFNSLDGDRRYNARQMSEIFNGILSDGVFANIGTAFKIDAHTGDTISIGIGRGWFNGTWIDNDAISLLTADKSDMIYNRYDAVVIEVNHTVEVRSTTIKFVKGTLASAPVKPTMIQTADIHQYPLAYVYRPKQSTSITQANIQNMIGTSSCPYITAILKTTNIDHVVAQWEAQWAEWFSDKTETVTGQVSQWTNEKELNFNTWFNGLKLLLDENVATNLANQLLNLNDRLDTLASDRSIYQHIKDSSNNFIEDSFASTVEGRVMFGAPSNTSSTPLSGLLGNADQEGY